MRTFLTLFAGAIAATFLAGIAGAQSLTVSVSSNPTWVYQNTPQLITLTGGHKSTLTVNVVTDTYPGVKTYAVTVTPSGPGQVTVQDIAGQPLQKDLVGGVRSGPALTLPSPGAGTCSLHLVVTNGVGGTASADITVPVRLLGDIDGNGVVEGADRTLLRMKLNAQTIVNEPVLAAFELCNAPDLPTGADLVLLDQILNQRITNYLPVADAGGDQHLYDTNGNGSEVVTLDGSASYDLDGTIASYVWKDGAAQLYSGTASTASATLSVGTHQLTLTVTDDDGALSTASLTVVVWNQIPSATVTAVTFTNASSVKNGGNDCDVGYSFRPSNWIQVTAVGYWDYQGNGLLWPHRVQMFTGNYPYPGLGDSSPAVVGEIVAPGDSTTQNGYVWHTMATPVILTPGTTYTLVAAVFGTAGSGTQDGDTMMPYGNANTFTGLAVSSLIGYVANSAAHRADYGGASAPLDTLYNYNTGIFLGNFRFHQVAPPNQAPVANAGSAQQVSDTDGDGYVQVRLDASGSSDTDGTIVSYVWTEFTGSGFTPLATGRRPLVTLGLGTHQLVLTVTDNSGAVSKAMVVVTITSPFAPPTADAGADSTVVDIARTGHVTVTLNGLVSTAGSGTITSYVWKENGVVVATGSTAQVSLDTTAQSKHDLQLIVTNSHGLAGSDVRRIWVMPQGTYFVDTNNANARDTNPGTEASPFKTIGKAVGLAAAGTVIIVKGGIYREDLATYASGTASRPIVLMGYPFDRVVISGADVVTGWTQCTQALARNNPNWANIYYKNISWLPTRVVQNGADLLCARTPSAGMWVGTSDGTDTTMVDAVNLTQADNYWNGATVTLDYRGADLMDVVTVTDYVQSTHTLTVSPSWHVPVAGRDGYYLSNKVEFINAPGQWVAESQGGGTYRLFVWATGGGNPGNTAIEASHRSDGLWTGPNGISYWTIDNIEIRHCTSTSLISSNGGNNGWLVQNCLFHHNDGAGLGLSGETAGVTVRYCVSVFNWSGMGLGGPNVLVEACEVGWDTVDGISPNGMPATVRRCYIHDHNGTDHPDNIQVFFTNSNLTVDSCFVICAVQSLMAETLVNLTTTNNVIVGAAAYSWIMGSTNSSTSHNTNLCAGYAVYNSNGTNGTWANNLTLGGWNASTGTTYSSDYNCFYIGDNATLCPLGYFGQSGGGFYWSQYLAASGQDSHSTLAAAQPLANVPVSFAAVTPSYSLSTRIIVAGTDISDFSVGDHIEIDWDGVVRTVTAVGANYVDFTPGSTHWQEKATQVANWKANTNYVLDVTPVWTSPAIGSASDGGNMGSSINITNYINGDFNGDGRRDIPDLP